MLAGNRFLVSLLVLLVASQALGNSDAYRVKERLQRELVEDYLPRLEDLWGKCAGSPEHCLSFFDDSARLSLPQRNLCFPYTGCAFYRCMEEKYHCSDVGVTYFTQLAFPTCSTYVENIEKGWFSKQGVEWIYEVMVCLQRGLIDECEVLGRCPAERRKETCEHITEFTLKFHPGCYINSGVGVCNLPLSDQINIWRTVYPYLTAREREEASKVMAYCAGFGRL